MRVRLRPRYTDEELATIYAVPHDHTHWKDHLLRVDATAQMARWLYSGSGPVVDLSCGDGACASQVGAEEIVLGDFAPGYPITGPIEETIHHVPHADVFLLCETLEHLDDPDAVLALLRPHARSIVVSTPLGEQDAANPEHYWGWDAEAVEGMLVTAGFSVEAYMELQIKVVNYGTVAYQVWGCT